MASIAPDLLGTLIEDKPELVQEALDKVHDGTGIQMKLDDIIRLDPFNTAEQAIIGYLTRFNKVREFIIALAGEGEAVADDDTAQARLDRIRQAGIDPDGLAAFSLAAKSFRCRILVNNIVMGSGVLVSYRLVLTAWHVVNRKQGWNAQNPPRIEVLTSDGQRLPARPTDPSSPCHPDEWDGIIPNDNELEGFDDFTLLRLSQPVGFALGFAEPVCPPPTWPGQTHCLLVHYPQGELVGLSPGQATFGGERRRFLHTALSDGGSSGGALFNNRLDMIGIHQKSVDGNRKFVPIRNFANDNSAELIRTLERDRRPTYLWSLDQTLDSHMVIGRRMFFDALDHMLDSDKAASKRLRGIWMRREQAEKDQSGLGFGFELLQAFLARRQPEARLVRIALRAGEYDLFKLIEVAFDGAAGASVARAGVREDETTPIAFEADRADALIRRIEAQVQGPIWLYIDGPRSELAGVALNQLEQLLARIMRSERIRFVLTRMETHQLPLTRFDTLDEIDESSAPGVVSEFTGDFELEDVNTTIRAASHDLELDLSPEQIDDIAKDALIGVQPQFGRYPAQSLGQVARRLVAALRDRAAAA
ncbi:MAG: serine protease [Pseudomonadota bacterium]